MYTAGWTDFTPTLSTSEYAAIVQPVSSAQIEAGLQIALMGLKNALKEKDFKCIT